MFDCVDVNRHAGAAVIAALSFFGCADAQLGQAQLQTPCAQSDAACDAAGDASSDVNSDVNAPIAAGARLDLIIRPSLQGALAVPLTLRPVDPEVVVLEEGMLRAVAPGISAVLLLAEDLSVIDVVHVSVQKAERLTLHRSLNNDVVVDERALPAVVQVFPGEEITLKLGVWAGAQQLGGDTGDLWSVTNPDYRLIDQGFARERRLRAPDAGSSVVAVVLPTGLRTEVTLEVVP
jgi:hypothetical protein